MFKNHFKIALRNIRKQGLRSVIHVIGLSIGVAVCFVIYNLVSFEYSFDKFHKDSDQIYRVTTVTSNGVEDWPNPGAPFPIGPAISNEMSAVNNVAQIFDTYRIMVGTFADEQKFGVKQTVTYADQHYFEIFEYKWLAGNKESSLSEANEVVLTESSVKQYFGAIEPEEALGKELIYADSIPFYVSGVVADFQENSDLKFTDFLSLQTAKSNKDISTRLNIEEWNSVNSSSQTIVKLNQNQKAKAEKELAVIDEKYGEDDEEWTTTFNLEPLSEWHFSSNFNYRSADKSVLNGLMLIGLFILVIACINFINLESAQARLRSKEVGIRKTLGSSRKQLIIQFLMETYVIILLAIIFGLILSQFGIRYFADILPNTFELDYLSMENLIFLLSLSVMVLFLSGLYPAMILSGYTPIKALNNKKEFKPGFNLQYFIRKNLIILQFSSSIAFIIAVLAINNQISFLMNKDVGFNKEAVLHISTPFQSTLDNTVKLNNSLVSLSEVKSTSMSSGTLVSNSIWTSSVEHEMNGELVEVSVQTKVADTNYLALYEVPFLAGRNYTTDESEVVINESALTALAISSPEEALGKHLVYDETDMTVVGVIKNVHTRSLHEEIRPLLVGNGIRNLFTVNIKLNKGANLASAVDAIQNAVKSIYPVERPEIKFLDETVEGFYQSEVRLRKILFFATIMAILISALGLFGLASFTISQRTKEISIRKVLGASVAELIVLISKEYAILIGIAFLLAAYPAWYFVKDWLSGFQYKIEVPYGIFILAGIIALILCMAIVSFHSLRAASSNPAKILKDE